MSKLHINKETWTQPLNLSPVQLRRLASSRSSQTRVFPTAKRTAFSNSGSNVQWLRSKNINWKPTHINLPTFVNSYSIHQNILRLPTTMDAMKPKNEELIKAILCKPKVESFTYLQRILDNIERQLCCAVQISQSFKHWLDTYWLKRNKCHRRKPLLFQVLHEQRNSFNPIPGVVAQNALPHVHHIT